MAREDLDTTIQGIADEIIRDLEKFDGFNRWYWEQLDPSERYEVMDVIINSFEEKYNELLRIISWSNEKICY